ncbi:MAG: DUF2007 domain-containing protein [Planctomycetes bacterium]|nr:DUF2007 domain-containing protein [Planctomycetota bacterium]
MPLQDPVAIYNASTNLQAQQVCMVLQQAGIEAFAVEDLSRGADWVGGLIPEIHKPQVWVDRGDSERARQVIANYEARAAALHGGPQVHDAQPIEMICEECEGQMTFPAAQRGSVQECPHCGAYVDVGEDSTEDDSEWSAADTESEPADDE